jgi:hypothetical protein
MVDTLWQNHDVVQTVIAVKWFRRKRVAVYPLHTFVLSVPKHQAIIQSKMPLRFADSCSSNVCRREIT